MAFRGTILEAGPSPSGRGARVVFRFTDDADPSFVEDMVCDAARNGIVTPTPEWAAAVVAGKIAELERLRAEPAIVTAGIAALRGLIGTPIAPQTDDADIAKISRLERAVLLRDRLAALPNVDPAELASLDVAIATARAEAVTGYRKAIAEVKAAIAAV